MICNRCATKLIEPPPHTQKKPSDDHLLFCDKKALSFQYSLLIASFSHFCVYHLHDTHHSENMFDHEGIFSPKLFFHPFKVKEFVHLSCRVSLSTQFNSCENMFLPWIIIKRYNYFSRPPLFQSLTNHYNPLFFLVGEQFC